MTIKEIRDYFRNTNNGNNKQFFIKTRPASEEDSKDIVYYNGIEAFSIDKKYRISIRPNIFLFNKDGIVHAREQKNNESDIKDIYYENKIEIMKYVHIKYKHIEISKTKTFNEKTFDRVKKIYEILKKNKEYFIDFDGRMNERDFYEKFSNKGKWQFKFCELLLNDDTLRKLNSLEFAIIKACIFDDNLVWSNDSGISKPIISISLDVDSEMVLQNSDSITKFTNIISSCINSYESLTGEEMEKKYQHQFMINNRMSFFQNLYPFDEEYYTEEKDTKSKNNRGRIDCVYLKFNGDCLYDIYLIELKVNNKVISGSNGIHKHLIDIKNLVTDDLKLSPFIMRIVKRYVDRENKEIKISSELKFHFYTYIAFTSDKEREKAKKLLQKLDTEEYINELIQKPKDDNDRIPAESLIISKQIQVVPCDTRIYLDKNDWNKNIVDGDFVIAYRRNNEDGSK